MKFTSLLLLSLAALSSANVVSRKSSLIAQKGDVTEPNADTHVVQVPVVKSGAVVTSPVSIIPIIKKSHIGKALKGKKHSTAASKKLDEKITKLVLSLAIMQLMIDATGRRTHRKYSKKHQESFDVDISKVPGTKIGDVVMVTAANGDQVPCDVIEPEKSHRHLLFKHTSIRASFIFQCVIQAIPIMLLFAVLFGLIYKSISYIVSRVSKSRSKTVEDESLLSDSLPTYSTDAGLKENVKV